VQLISENPISQSVDLDANYMASYRGAIEHFLNCLASGALRATLYSGPK